jgi:hypothetical protein
MPSRVKKGAHKTAMQFSRAGFPGMDIKHL